MHTSQYDRGVDLKVWMLCSSYSASAEPGSQGKDVVVVGNGCSESG